jgi:uncharacterized membrane protein YqgA involved in biofilm formation
MQNQSFLKAALGGATAFAGVWLTWKSINGTPGQILWQFAIVLLAMVLGKVAGRLLQLQKLSNRLGQFARRRIAAATPGRGGGYSDGVNVCAALFCAAPLGILGAISESLGSGPVPLLIKSVMDGLAAFSFVALFGWTVVLSALPVLAFQGTISLAVGLLALPWLSARHLVDPVNATAGLLIFAVSLLIFEVRRVEVADYLPSLIWVPLLTLWLA